MTAELLYSPVACSFVRMGNEWRTRFRETLATLNVADYARAVDRPYRTVQDWKLGNRNPPPEALHELAGYLRSQARAFAAAADELEAVAPPREEDSDG